VCKIDRNREREIERGCHFKKKGGEGVKFRVRVKVRV